MYMKKRRMKQISKYFDEESKVSYGFIRKEMGMFRINKGFKGEVFFSNLIEHSHSRELQIETY